MSVVVFSLAISTSVRRRVFWENGGIRGPRKYVNGMGRRGILGAGVKKERGGEVVNFWDGEIIYINLEKLKHNEKRKRVHVPTLLV